MSTVKRIRKDVLGLTQAEFGAVAGVSQATVSKWENGNLFPNLKELTAIRSAATQTGKEWNDSWIFEVSPAKEAQQ